jgi:hypothetical protein
MIPRRELLLVTPEHFAQVPFGAIALYGVSDRCF